MKYRKGMKKLRIITIISKDLQLKIKLANKQ